MPFPGLLMGLALSVSAGTGKPLPDQAILRAAEADFQRGLELRGTSLHAGDYFGRAARGYEELCRRGAYNAPLYGNLGQAYLLAGDVPRAILAFRRGLRLAPNDTTLQDRLEQARAGVVYEVSGPFGRPPVDDWPPWLPRLGVRLGFLAALALYGLTWGALTGWWITRSRAWLVGTIASLSALTLLGFGLVRQADERAWDRDHPAVVISVARVVLHKGNGAGYPCYDARTRTWLEPAGGVLAEATPLHRGAEARLRFARGDWLQIELAGGEIGWVRKRHVVTDPPWKTGAP